MKKYIFIVVVSLCMFTPTKILATDSDINLNPDVLKDKNEIYSSITDIYDTKIFSDKYKEGIENKIKKEKENKDKLLNNLFSNNENGNDKEDLRLKEKDGLFMSNKSTSNNIEVKEGNNNYALIGIVTIIGLSISVLIIVATNRFYKNKRDKEDRSYVYYNNHNK